MLDHIASISASEATPDHPLHDCLPGLTDAPEPQLRWAEKLFANRHSDAGRALTLTAIDHASADRKPGIIFSLAARFLEQNGFQGDAAMVRARGTRELEGNVFFVAQQAQRLIKVGEAAQAIALLAPIHRGDQGDAVTANTLGNALIHAGRPGEAVALLAPIHRDGQGDAVTASTLGNALIHAGRPDEAVALLAPIHRGDQGNAVTANTLGNAMIQAGRPGDAIALLEPLHRNNQGNIVTACTLGNAMIQTGRPGDAIALLEPLHRNNQGDIVITNTLGNAMIQAGRPGDAVALLEPLHRNNLGNIVTTNTLGNAYVETRERDKFNALQPSIKDESLRCYLTAKLFYYLGEPARSQRVLQPYISSAYLEGNIAALYMASLGDDSPVHAVIHGAFGQARYDYLLERCDEWRDNPCRAELQDLKFSSAQTLYELGGVPASQSDRLKAGLQNTPVASSPGGNLFRPHSP